MKVLISTFLAAMFFGAQLTNAMIIGGSSDGGGKGIVCVENGRKNVYLADTFELVRKGTFAKIRPADPAAVLAAATELIEMIRPEKLYPHPFKKKEKVSLAWLLEFKANGLSYSYSAESTFRELNDDNINSADLPFGCKKVQLAIQNIAKGSVILNYPFTSKLSWMERGFLELHETMVALRNLPGADTTPIRREIETIAQLLSDSKFELHEKILAILNPGPVAPGQTEWTWAQTYIYENCGSRYLPTEPQPGDDFKTAFCRIAAKQAAEQDRENFLATALPTLTRFPEAINCQITYEGANHLGLPRPESFTFTRISGDGRPSSENVFEFESESSAPGQGWRTQRSWFLTDSHRREAGFKKIGDMSFSATFTDAQGNLATLFIDEYHELTQLFTGSLQTKSAGYKHHDRFTAFGVTCDGGSPEFLVLGKSQL